jgi:hypothetical protein
MFRYELKLFLVRVAVDDLVNDVAPIISDVEVSAFCDRFTDRS